MILFFFLFWDDARMPRDFKKMSGKINRDTFGEINFAEYLPPSQEGDMQLGNDCAFLSNVSTRNT